MDRYLMDPKTGTLVIIRDKGEISFHNVSGFKAEPPLHVLPQQSVVKLLLRQGWVEVPPS